MDDTTSRTASSDECAIEFEHDLLPSRHRSDGGLATRKQLPSTTWRKHCLTTAADEAKAVAVLVVVTGFIALCALWFDASARATVFPRATCMGGQWPLFHTEDELSAHKPWAKYMEAVYGRLPSGGYPMCMGELWFMYSRGLNAAGVEPGRDLPATVSVCPRDDGKVAGQQYAMNSRLSPPNTTWSWHPAPQGYAAFEAHSWVEVLHRGGISDEHVGAWFLHAKGSGIWLQLGSSIAFDDHQDGWSHFGVSHLEKDRRNEAMCANASAAGYDSIQFVRHTCKMMYGDCLNESIPMVRAPKDRARDSASSRNDVV